MNQPADQAYDKAAKASSRAVVKEFSDSFWLACTLLPRSVRESIFSIYGLVRLADEIVDSYTGTDRAILLAELERETYTALECGFSTNLLVHAFQQTARQYGIDQTLLQPFFHSMRMDLEERTYTPALFQAYVHGSAEVVGLMCLKVFCRGDESQYNKLRPGARALGAGFQKVNFLRDLQSDNVRLGRYYFPAGTYNTFDDDIKSEIIVGIRRDFDTAAKSVNLLPPDVRPAVKLASRYYRLLLGKLARIRADELKHRRIRINHSRKLFMLLRAYAASSVRLRR